MMNSILYICAFLTAFKGVQAGFDPNSNSQNSFGKLEEEGGQKSLGFYCKNAPEVDVFIISFVTKIFGRGGFPEVNFANAGNNCTTIPGTGLLKCPQIAEDITACQNLGKTILISIGGGTYKEGGFPDEGTARDSAVQLWELFGSVRTISPFYKYRPFGDAVVNGFDLDFENQVMKNAVVFANTMRNLFPEDPSRQYFLTVAPQCPYPDLANNEMLDGAVWFDAVLVQFYNNYCGVNAFVPGAPQQPNFNFDTWNTWADNISLNPNVKIILGVLGNFGAGSGYVTASIIGAIIQYIFDFRWTSFGGVMIWDASQGFPNPGFISEVRSSLPPKPTPTTTTTSTPTPSTTTTTPTPTPSTTTTTPTPTPSTTTTTPTPTPSTTTTTPTPTPTPPATTTTSKESTTTTTTSTAPSITCPVPGGPCPTDGVYACAGNRFGVCNHGQWVFESCPPGLICVQAGSGVYCDHPSAAKPVC
uniref:chitinase n=1 Tax=Talaromyces marneffei PM1 TaxID=1077442 RepID=A0A093UNV2_TALMA